MKGINSLLLILFLAALFSCGEKRAAERSDLMRADSLMWIRPDSSLAILRQVEPAELDEANRAYYALLMTQAQFRNNGFPKSDSLISIALDYYGDNHNRERLTRTLTYRGFVSESNDKASEAMEWYLRAEANADKNDYQNLGNIYIRMGVLHREHLSRYKEDLHCFLKSYEYYLKVGDKSRQLNCLMNIGGLYRGYKPDSASYYLSKGGNLAMELGDTVVYVRSKEYISRNELWDSCYRAGVDVLMPVVRDFPAYVDNEVCLDLAYGYAMIGKADSARLYYDRISGAPSGYVEKGMRILTLSRVCAAEHDYKGAYENLVRENQFSDSLLARRPNKEIFNVVTRNYENTISGYLGLIKTSVPFQLMVLLFLVITLVWVTAILSLRLMKRNRIIRRLRRSAGEAELEIVRADEKKRAVERNQEMEERIRVAESYMHKLQEVTSRNETLKSIVESHIESMRKLVKSSYGMPDNDFMREFNKVAFISSAADKGFWAKLRDYINLNYGNLIEDIRQGYPEVNEQELIIIELMCCDFTMHEIAICMGYKDKDSVRSIKSRIKGKLGLSESLDEFLLRKKGE